MHEMSIVQGILDVCTRHAAGRTVVALVVEIGELSGVMPEAIEFCFSACCKDTALEHAQLSIESVPAVGFCEDCRISQPLTSLYDSCQQCGGYRLTVTSGQEMRVREMEVSDGPDEEL